MKPTTSQIIVLKKKRKENDPSNIVDFFHQSTSLSKMIIKKLMVAGGVWQRKGKDGKLLRVRKATTALESSDYLELHYDPKLLDLKLTAEAAVIFEGKGFGLWNKPAGQLSQGTPFGDHLSILRQVEKRKGETYLIHRLDREASGLMIFAHNKRVASSFGKQLQQEKIKKYYQAVVKGDLAAAMGLTGEIRFPLDGKAALTKYQVVGMADGQTQVFIQILSGRFHQIRRHFDRLGFPVMGDPLYGKDNKNQDGLKLMATKLEFFDPNCYGSYGNSEKKLSVELPQELRLFTKNSFS